MRPLIPATLLLALVACSGGGQTDPTGLPADARLVGGVEYSAESFVLESFPVQLHTIVTATNTSDATLDIWFPDGCVVLLRAGQQGAAGVEPAWDQRRDAVCGLAIVERTLAPGDTAQFGNRLDARRILGDSLPDGRYRLTAVIRPANEQVELAAGVVDLAVPR